MDGPGGGVIDVSEPGFKLLQVREYLRLAVVAALIAIRSAVCIVIYIRRYVGERLVRWG